MLAATTAETYTSRYSLCATFLSHFMRKLEKHFGGSVFVGGNHDSNALSVCQGLLEILRSGVGVRVSEVAHKAMCSDSP